jgi:hypothetical protein
MGRHDLSYHLFFTHRRMIQDLLREIVGEQWVSRIDFDSGERTVPPSEASLRRAFETWLHKVILPRIGTSDEEISATVTLEGFATMLAESIDRVEPSDPRERTTGGGSSGGRDRRRIGSSSPSRPCSTVFFGALPYSTGTYWGSQAKPGRRARRRSGCCHAAGLTRTSRRCCQY